MELKTSENFFPDDSIRLQSYLYIPISSLPSWFYHLLVAMVTATSFLWFYLWKNKNKTLGWFNNTFSNIYD